MEKKEYDTKVDDIRLKSLKEGEIRVYYKTEDGLDEKLDDALIAVMDGLGYRMWACGTDLTTMIRDLAFDRRK